MLDGFNIITGSREYTKSCIIFNGVWPIQSINLQNGIKLPLFPVFPSTNRRVREGKKGMDHIESECIQFEKELEKLINRFSMESDSDTPDFLLAKYLCACLDAYNTIISDNRIWKSQ